MEYPFTPKSTSTLTPGQFWAVPMTDGRFACGRVLQLNTEEIPSKTRGFFGGLHDWVGDARPNADTISDSNLIAFGIMHIKTISSTGGEILGHRDFALDEITMPMMASACGGNGTMILAGSKQVRPATRDEWGVYPVLGVWGYDFITRLAETKLSGKDSVG